MTKLAFLDIESSSLAEDSIVTCAAIGITLRSEIITDVFCGGMFKLGGPITPLAEDPTAIAALIDRLAWLLTKDYKVFTWNGAGYDWAKLQEMYSDAPWEQWVRHSYDPFLQALYQSGSMVGLDAAAKGLGTRLKSGEGADAPLLWASGKRGEVLQYVADDVEVLAEVVQAIVAQRGLYWQDKKAGIHVIPLSSFLPVGTVLQLLEPDLSWMDEPFNLNIIKERWTKYGHS
jgi:alpha-beta hydrolase superfamily lysophospholipase